MMGKSTFFNVHEKTLKPKLIDIKISHEHTPANIYLYIRKFPLSLDSQMDCRASREDAASALDSATLLRLMEWGICLVLGELKEHEQYTHTMSTVDQRAVR